MSGDRNECKLSDRLVSQRMQFYCYNCRWCHVRGAINLLNEINFGAHKMEGKCHQEKAG